MFSEICQGILPLALRNITRRGDLERAGLLIESLAKHWKDRKPFELLIIAPSSDASLLRQSLPRFPNIDVSVRPERDFFPAFSPFYLLTGWYRQQVLKLHVPALLKFGGYLTLDSDVCCVGDFDSRTFIEHDRALSRWEPKRHHGWWQQAAKVIGVPYDPKAHGLSVTPNILHSDLAAQTMERLRGTFLDPLWSLVWEGCGRRSPRPGRSIRSTPAPPRSTAPCSTITPSGTPATCPTSSFSRKSPASGAPMISSGW